MAQHSNQIFFDRTGRRSAVVYGGLVSLAAFLVGLVIVFVFSIVATPALPSIGLQLERQYLPDTSATKRVVRKDEPQINLKHARAPDNAKPSKVKRYGFLVNWDENSFVSLRDNAAAMDVLIPEWLHAVDDSGNFKLDDQSRQKHIALWLKLNAPHLRVMPLINNYDAHAGVWQGPAIGRMLRSPEKRRRFAVNLTRYLLRGGFAGTVLDFKQIPEVDKPFLIKLAGELRTIFAKRRLKLLMALPAYEKAANIVELAKSVDQLILLAYDQHWSHNSPGPLAGQGWFEAHLDKRFANLTGDKIIIALGSYAIDWAGKGGGRLLSVRAAWEILRQSRSDLKFDERALNPTFSYFESQTGKRHTTWMLDGVTAYNQVAAALAMKPAGIALWRLGTEDPTVWQSFGRNRGPDQKALRALAKIAPGASVNYKGKGEVLKFIDQPQAGLREVKHLPKYNLIVNQKMAVAPRSMMVSRWGFNQDKVIALTFDDGPSKAYTTKILDVLDKKKVKATFFVVGAAAAMESDIMRRIYNSGHDIGNHTFTHPDLTEIPSAQLDLELNATQRVLESTLGIRSALFRPPFVRDIEPETRNQARTLLASAALGYITIGQRIDPLDWGRPGADEIVDRTINYAAGRKGNVVLLHDGGGDRSQTIEALPRIIDKLRADGFRFVTIHELLGLKRDALMPRLTSTADYVPLVNRIGIELASGFTKWMSILFLAGIALGATRLCFVTVMAWKAVRKERRHEWQAMGRKPRVSVIVPAYNEAAVIADSIGSILQSNDSDFDIYVVDDGSKDDTVQIVRRVFGAEPRVKLLCKRNGGKASALNHGIRMSKADIVVCVDADTRLDPDAIGKLRRHFADPAIGAVAGVVTVGNHRSLLARFQALEYLTAQNLDRRAFGEVNAIAVVPGAIGAWRRDALVDVGLYDTDTVAEDADITIRLQRAGWRVVNEPKAFATTEAPETLREFFTQRYRWMFGTLQVAVKHADVFFQRQAWGLKLFTIPNIVLFQFVFTLLSPLMDLMLVAGLLADGWSAIHHETNGLSGGTSAVLAFWIAFQAIELSVAAYALHLHGDKAAFRLLPLTILQRFCYRQLIYWIALQTLVAALRGRMRGWGSLKRVGLATAARPEPDQAPPAAGQRPVRANKPRLIDRPMPLRPVLIPAE